MRSASGNPEAVIIDGGYNTTEIVTVAASDVTIAELTLQKAYTHPIHVTSSSLGDTTGTLIYRVNIIDPRQQAIKINPHDTSGVYPDDGEVACSSIVLTDDGRSHVDSTSSDGCYTGGVDAHQADGWVIRDNYIEGFWCPSGLSEHAIHMWRGCRGTLVERNTMVNNARGVGFGMMTSGTARTYSDDPCPGVASGVYVGNYEGTVRNNVIVNDRQELFDSNAGADCGVCLWSSCETVADHNTIYTSGYMFSAMEWRFAASVDLQIRNNLATHTLMEREDASTTTAGNIETATAALFADASGRDLHLAASATAAIDQGTPLDDGVCDYDMDMDPRDDTPDVGADEVTD